MDLMIDLETLGTDTKCPVISIGAVFFDTNKKILGPTFYAKLELDEQFKKSRNIDASTLKWWLGQKDAAKQVFKENPTPVDYALRAFVKFVKQHKNVKPWGNGATFDISIIEDLLKQYGHTPPWMFRNVMDLRTFKRFMADGKKIEVKGTAHNALDDAKAQAQFVIDNL